VLACCSAEVKRFDLRGDPASAHSSAVIDDRTALLSAVVESTEINVIVFCAVAAQHCIYDALSLTNIVTEHHLLHLQLSKLWPLHSFSEQ
jgi:hypothetical protein